jgi:hypothetical protein
MAEQIYPKGMRVWSPREGAPDFVKGKISIHLETFIEWAQKHLDEKGFIAFDLKEGRDGIYASLNTWRKGDAPVRAAKQETPPDDDILSSIPF